MGLSRSPSMLSSEGANTSTRQAPHIEAFSLETTSPGSRQRMRTPSWARSEMSRS